VGVGILGHKRNPLPEYWWPRACRRVTVQALATLTGRTSIRSGDARTRLLSRFDFRKVQFTFAECAPEVILYASEGVSRAAGFWPQHKGHSRRARTRGQQIRDMAQLADGN
jgi:hypothetical protein